MAFTSPATGWAAAVDQLGWGPYLATSADGGDTWSPFQPSARDAIGVARLTARSNHAELLRVDGDGTQLTALESSAKREGIGVADGFRGSAVASIDSRTWVAGTAAEGADAAPIRPAIYALQADGSWVSEDVKLDAPAQLWSLDVRDAATGLAAGVLVGTPLQPACVYKNAAGSWVPSSLPTEIHDMVPVAVARNAGGNGGWLVVNKWGTFGTAFLSTVDGGVTWERVPTKFDETARITTLATDRRFK